MATQKWWFIGPAVVPALVSLGTQAVRPAFAGQDAPAFTLRAEPRWATRLNDVLARVAQPTTVLVPADADIERFLARLCGGHVPARVGEASPSDTSGMIVVRFAPCMRFRSDGSVVLEKGNTLEGVAARHGLPTQDAASLEVTPSSKWPQPRTTTTLQPGDVVLLPRQPLWTQVFARRDVIVDRAAMVSALAEGVGCKPRDAEQCLVERGIVLLDRASVPRVPPSLAPVQPPPRQFVRAIRAPTAAKVTPAKATAAVAGTPTAPGLAMSGSVNHPPPAAAAPVLAALPPVARDQWPYDIEQLAAAMKETAATARHRVVIGIADGGLAGADGGPLPATWFGGRGEDNPEPDLLDDDENDYIDDLVGAGVQRAGAPELSGDVSLCESGPLPNWGAADLLAASHGTIVTAVAAAMPVRTAHPDLDDALPKVTFYRMLAGPCGPHPDFGVNDGEAISAFDYLEPRSHVINVSYLAGGTGGEPFVNALMAGLTSSNKLLVLPAGNQAPGNLDTTPVCPACLGNRANFPGPARRTIVVGAATRGLLRTTFSNFGPLTVSLYAPGEATGTIDIVGHDASGAGASTSYAAPYVALAAGIARALGVDDVKDLRDFLEVATWPLYDADGQPDAGAGVVDVLKAAAARHHAVEVVEPDAEGMPVRRTYVGTLDGDLQQLSLCAGKIFRESALYGLRFEVNADGDRRVRLYGRQADPIVGRQWGVDTACRMPSPEAVVRMKTLLDGDKLFRVSAVTQVQLRWIRGS